MDKSIQENTLKFNEALIEEILPKMPAKGSLKAKLAFCAVIAERQAKLQRQQEWLEETQEYYRKLREE